MMVACTKTEPVTVVSHSPRPSADRALPTRSTCSQAVIRRTSVFINLYRFHRGSAVRTMDSWGIKTASLGTGSSKAPIRYVASSHVQVRLFLTRPNTNFGRMSTATEDSDSSS